MKNSNRVLISALTGAVVLGATTMSANATAAENEKCAGVVKAGKNDCATSANSCAGTAKTNGDKEAWIYVPKGTCDKIVGGTVIGKK